MRIILITVVATLTISATALAQRDFKTLDKETYEYFMKGDYRNLKKSADTLLSQGTDYYYIRLRLGITAFNYQKYAESAVNFQKALEFNSSDTISTEYLFYCYLYSGRKNDAALYPGNISSDFKSPALLSAEKKPDFEIFAGSSVSSFSRENSRSTALYRESLHTTYSLYGGFEARFLKRFTGKLALTSFTKTGRLNSYEYQSGADFFFSQFQVYAKLSSGFFPGWEASVFGTSAIYTTLQSTNEIIKEYNLGTGVSKSWWKIRAGGDFSVSNFSNSTQIREEGFLTWLPQGNLNFYLTAGGMFQYDVNWGTSFQYDQTAGYKITKKLWGETGFIAGNAFLYARNQGYEMNNSFQIPSVVIYTNIILPLKKMTFSFSPYFAQYQNYSWNFSSYTRSGRTSVNTFGAAIKINYNNR